MDIEEWAENQKAEMIAAGVHPIDAEESVQWVVDNIPQGEDPDEWIPGQELLTSVTRGDQAAVSDAKADWYADEAVASQYNFVLDATPVETEDEGREREIEAAAGILLYLWIRRQRRYYRHKPFTPVAEGRVRALLDGHLSARERDVSDLVTAFHEGRVAPGPWTRQMETALRRLHLEDRALGGGGFRNLTDMDYVSVDRRLVDDYGRLRDFAEDVREGRLTLSQAQNRARMYVGNARTQFWEALDGQAQVRAGMSLLDRRVLTPADHCGDCVEYYHMGWQPMGVLPPPGQASQCLSNCRCYKLYAEVPAEEAGEWIGTKRR